VHPHFYFAESDVTPAFSQPESISGSSRNLACSARHQTLYWRAYSSISIPIHPEPAYIWHTGNGSHRRGTATGPQLQPRQESALLQATAGGSGFGGSRRASSGPVIVA